MRKPSIILTAADKKSAAKDLRAELKVAKAQLRETLAGIKAATKVAADFEKKVAALEARLETMDEGCRRPRTRKASGTGAHHRSSSGGQGVDAQI
jgi:hypothetical protein